jgi:formylglycine-generating enzyme required for sulfatase activity
VRFLQVIAVTRLALACAPAPSHAEKRVALVIGNERYANLTANEQLQKAVNDARAVGGALKVLGFDVVSGENLGRQAMLARLDEAAQRIAPGDTVFFFFSGHGVAMDGLNYILPTDVPAVGSGQIASLTGAAVREEDIINRFQSAGARVAVIVLDACRNNPFAGSGTKGVGGDKGLLPHEPPSGVFTLYAASRGETALDRLYDGDRNPNSVFTRALLPALARPDLDLPALAREVREEVTRVAEAVGRAQRPAYYDETRGDRIFLARAPNDHPAGEVLPPGIVSAPPPGSASAPAVPSAAQHPVPTAGPHIGFLAPPVTPAAPATDQCSGPVTASFASQCHMPLTAAQERGLKPKDIFRECDGCPEMVVIPAGSFTMGSPGSEKERLDFEGPQHIVTIRTPFAVGKLHVTVEQYAAFVRDTGYEKSRSCRWSNPGFAQDGSHPVVCVAWDDAKAYAAWLAKKTGKPYRLLSEAEWEFAARGRTSSGTYPRFWFGDDENDLCKYGNFADQKYNASSKYGKTSASCDDGYEQTSPAGHFLPNAFGLYDMFGNAYQWVEDCWHKDYKGTPADGSAWTPAGCGTGRVVRGGSWWAGPAYVRAASRMAYTAEVIHVGFRLARTLAP